MRNSYQRGVQGEAPQPGQNGSQKSNPRRAPQGPNRIGYQHDPGLQYRPERLIDVLDDRPVHQPCRGRRRGHRLRRHDDSHPPVR